MTTETPVPAERLVDRFHRAVEAIPRDAYPPELEPVDRHVEGVAAFPAGDGLYVPCGSSARPDLPDRPVVLVGNHLDNAATYRDRLARGLPHGDPCPHAKRMRFWNVLYHELLDPAGVPRERMFATNVHPALWSPGGASGNVPRRGPTHHAWYDRARRLLGDQLKGARPVAVVALGAQARREVGHVLGVAIRHADGPIQVDLPARAGTTVVGALAHPSARPVTMARRTWDQRVGRAADAALLAAAWHLGDVT